TKTRNAAVEWKLRPPPSKAARTILRAHNQVKPSHDRVVFCYIFDFLDDIAVLASAAHSVTPHRSSSLRDPAMWPTFRRASGIKATAAIVDFADAFLAAASIDRAMRRRPQGCRILGCATGTSWRRAR
ncbi:MAG TPA: hypothetical protein VF901_01115, partial [Bradyrhizobium sp.]